MRVKLISNESDLLSRIEELEKRVKYLTRRAYHLEEHTNISKWRLRESFHFLAPKKYHERFGAKCPPPIHNHHATRRICR